MEAHCVALPFEGKVVSPLLQLVLALLLCEVWCEAHSFVACAVLQLTGSSQHLDALGGITNLHKHRGGWSVSAEQRKIHCCMQHLDAHEGCAPMTCQPQ